MWALVFLLGPGVFFPVEQEVSRAVAARTSVGTGVGPVVRRAGAAAGMLAISITLVVAALSGPLLHQVFDDQVLVLLGFAASLFGYATVHLTRGLLSGTGRFRPYAVLLGAEGILRLAGAVTLLALGVRTAGPLALIVGLAPFAAVAVAVVHQRDLLGPGPPAPWAELTRSLGLLLLGSLLAQVLVHAGPLAVKLLAGEGSGEVTARFFAGVLLTRMPLFLFFAVQAALLPQLAACAVRQDRVGFCHSLNRLLVLVGGVGIASVAGAFLLGQEAMVLLFGPGFGLDDRGLGLLAASSAAIMVALALGQALVALNGQAGAAACWLAGTVSFMAVTAMGNDTLLRVEVGLVAGSSIAAAAMALSLIARMGRCLPPGGPSVIHVPPFLSYPGAAGEP